MARRPAATRFKWVRLPPAFLDRPTDESDYIFAKGRLIQTLRWPITTQSPTACPGIHRNYDDPKVSNFRATGSSVSVSESL